MGKQNISASIFLISILGFYHANSLLTDPSSYSCSPQRYVFKLNFSGNCPPTNQTYNGIESFACETTLAEKVEGDVAPVVLDSLTLSEYGTEGEKKRETINEPNDGIEIQYNSLTLDNSQYLLGSLVISAKGTNKNNEIVDMFVLIDFDETSCGVEPFDDLKNIGWISIEATTPARRSTCQCPTFLPSSPPTNTLSNIPSNKASTVPSFSPSSTLSNIPSNKPSTGCKTTKSGKCEKSKKGKKSSKSKSKKSKSQIQPKSSKSNTKKSSKSKSPKSKKHLRVR